MQLSNQPLLNKIQTLNEKFNINLKKRLTIIDYFNNFQSEKFLYKEIEDIISNIDSSSSTSSINFLIGLPYESEYTIKQSEKVKFIKYTKIKTEQKEFLLTKKGKVKKTFQKFEMKTFLQSTEKILLSDLINDEYNIDKSLVKYIFFINPKGMKTIKVIKLMLKYSNSQIFLFFGCCYMSIYFKYKLYDDLYTSYKDINNFINNSSCFNKGGLWCLKEEDFSIECMNTNIKYICQAISYKNNKQERVDDNIDLYIKDIKKRQSLITCNDSILKIKQNVISLYNIIYKYILFQLKDDTDNQSEYSSYSSIIELVNYLSFNNYQRLSKSTIYLINKLIKESLLSNIVKQFFNDMYFLYKLYFYVGILSPSYSLLYINSVLSIQNNDSSFKILYDEMFIHLEYIQDNLKGMIYEVHVKSKCDYSNIINTQYIYELSEFESSLSGLSQKSQNNTKEEEEDKENQNDEDNKHSQYIDNSIEKSNIKLKTSEYIDNNQNIQLKIDVFKLKNEEKIKIYKEMVSLNKAFEYIIEDYILTTKENYLHNIESFLIDIIKKYNNKKCEILILSPSTKTSKRLLNSITNSLHHKGNSEDYLFNDCDYYTKGLENRKKEIKFLTKKYSEDTDNVSKRKIFIGGGNKIKSKEILKEEEEENLPNEGFLNELIKYNNLIYNDNNTMNNGIDFIDKLTKRRIENFLLYYKGREIQSINEINNIKLYIDIKNKSFTENNTVTSFNDITKEEIYENLNLNVSNDVTIENINSIIYNNSTIKLIDEERYMKNEIQDLLSNITTQINEVSNEKIIVFYKQTENTNLYLSQLISKYHPTDNIYILEDDIENNYNCKLELNSNLNEKIEFLIKDINYLTDKYTNLFNEDRERNEKKRIIFDLREMSCDFPYVLSEEFILSGQQLDIGDYILFNGESEICIERKSIITDDLNSSLLSNRLYDQIINMKSKYNNTVLLIELDEDMVKNPFFDQKNKILYRNILQLAENNGLISSNLRNDNQSNGNFYIIYLYGLSELNKLINGICSIPNLNMNYLTTTQNSQSDFNLKSKNNEKDDKIKGTIDKMIKRIKGIDSSNTHLVLKNFKNMKDFLLSERKRLVEIFGNDKGSVIYNFFNKRFKKDYDKNIL